MMLVFPYFENVGAVTGLLPLTGFPLPLSHKVDRLLLVI